MKMFGCAGVCALMLMMLVGDSHALSDAHKMAIHKHTMEMAELCTKSNPLAEDEIAALKDKRLPDTNSARCFIACMLKNAGAMDESGMMSKEGALATAEKIFSDAPEQVDNMKEYLHMCSDVNEKPVSDGAAGCERAQHAFTCMTEHASKFGFDM